MKGYLALQALSGSSEYLVGFSSKVHSRPKVNTFKINMINHAVSILNQSVKNRLRLNSLLRLQLMIDGGEMKKHWMN